MIEKELVFFKISYLYWKLFLITMKHVAFKVFAIFLICSSSLFSQSKSLETKGNFKILESKRELTQADMNKINSANFNDYRFYNLKKKVQLVNGPLIELLSIKEMEENGVVIPKSMVDVAKSKSEIFKHESILILNLGLGIYTAYEPK